MTDIPVDQLGGHWDAAYQGRGDDVSWFQVEPQPSLDLIGELAAGPDTAIIDVGGGASMLVDRLAERGFIDLTVLDISQAALETGRRRLPGVPVTWLRADLLTWLPQRRYGVWHDRAVLHFLTDPADRAVYLATLRAALEPGGAVVLGVFAPDGPASCSGLPVARYSPQELAGLLGPAFTLVHTRGEEHTTPAGGHQPFTWLTARKAPRS
jgi:SAM-dependent methyltransferase